MSSRRLPVEPIHPSALLRPDVDDAIFSIFFFFLLSMCTGYLFVCQLPNVLHMTSRSSLTGKAKQTNNIFHAIIICIFLSFCFFYFSLFLGSFFVQTTRRMQMCDPPDTGNIMLITAASYLYSSQRTSCIRIMFHRPIS